MDGSQATSSKSVSSKGVKFKFFRVKIIGAKMRATIDRYRSEQADVRSTGGGP